MYTTPDVIAYARLHNFAPTGALETFLWQLASLALLPLLIWAGTRFFPREERPSLGECYLMEFGVYAMLGLILLGFGIIGLLFPLLEHNEHLQPGFTRNLGTGVLAFVTFFFVLWPTGEWLTRTARLIGRCPPKLVAL